MDMIPCCDTLWSFNFRSLIQLVFKNIKLRLRIPKNNFLSELTKSRQLLLLALSKYHKETKDLMNIKCIHLISS